MPNNPITPTNEARTNGTVIDASHTNDLASALNRLVGITSTASSAGTLTLVVGSMRTQQITGTTTHTVVMPVVSTLGLGFPFKIINDSTGIVTVNSSGGNLIYAIPAGVTVDFICILLTGTTAASWLADYPAAASTALVGVQATALGTTQSFTSNVVGIVAFSTEGYDTDNFHDNVTNNSRLTIPTGKTGNYLLSFLFGTSEAGGNYNSFYIYKNGATISTQGINNGKVYQSNDAANTIVRSISLFLTLTAADYIEMGILSDWATGNKTVYSQFGLYYLGA